MTRTNGVIMAGGQATRLEPLGYHMSKILLTVGQRPMLVNQVDWLRRSGVDGRICVVAAQSNVDEVRALIERTGLANVFATVQPHPWGPVDAIWSGVSKLDDDDAVIIINGDTFLEAAIQTEGSWIAVAPAPSLDRSWCYQVAPSDYEDAIPEGNVNVTCGAYRFQSTKDVRNVAEQVIGRKVTAQMAPFLTAMCVADPTTVEHTVVGWTDVGDVMAVQRARLDKFIVRSTHRLVGEHSGIVTKYAPRYEARFMRERAWLMSRSLNPMFPTVLDTGHNESEAWYKIEYFDYPTLAESYLYRGGSASTWKQILADLIDRMERSVWTVHTQSKVDDLRKWYYDKTVKRMIEAGYEPPHIALLELSSILDQDVMVNGHGDLAFTNILYAPMSGVTKLIDPRGDAWVPKIYELAKLRASYRWLSPIMHGLFNPDTGAIFPNNQDRIAAMDEVISAYCPLSKVAAAEAMILLAALPLHSEEEAVALHAAGQQTIREVI